MSQTNLTNQFLIAMPNLKGFSFEKTVSYICVHNEEGAMGIVINKPLNIDLGQILQQMDIQCDIPETKKRTVLQGGPVQIDRGFILHYPDCSWDSSITIADNICMTTSKDILMSIAEGNGPDKSLIALGYAGWAKGQLEQELMNNTWLNGPADPDIIFNTPHDKCWHAATKHIGIDIDKLSSDIGHA